MTYSGIGAAAGAGARGPVLMSIGEVLAKLRGEFPDITISKLRFLEAEGLVEPQRTAAGYRKYSVADLSRLRFVLATQRDHYLPLRVIREQLAALDAGEGAGAVTRAALSGQPASADQPGAGEPGPLAGPGPLVGLAPRRATLVPVEPEVPAEPAEPRLTRDELLTRSGLAEPLLAELEQLGLIRARHGWYDADALTIARVTAQLAGYGLEPRHLRAYRVAADREVGLFAQLVAPVARQNTPAAQARAAEVVRELAALSQQLHAALVRMGLRETLGQ